MLFTVMLFKPLKSIHCQIVWYTLLTKYKLAPNGEDEGEKIPCRERCCSVDRQNGGTREEAHGTILGVVRSQGHGVVCLKWISVMISSCTEDRSGGSGHHLGSEELRLGYKGDN